MRMQPLIAAVAVAAPAAFASVPSGIEVLPEQQQQGVVEYLSGGARHDEELAIRRAAHLYSVELVFREKVGNEDVMLGGMPVTITDSRGRVVFQGTADGPFFLARLPKGSYTVTTKWEDWSFSRPFTVGDETDRVVFEWKKDAGQAPLA